MKHKLPELASRIGITLMALFLSSWGIAFSAMIAIDFDGIWASPNKSLTLKVLLSIGCIAIWVSWTSFAAPACAWILDRRLHRYVTFASVAAAIAVAVAFTPIALMTCAPCVALAIYLWHFHTSDRGGFSTIS